MVQLLAQKPMSFEVFLELVFGLWSLVRVD